MLGRASHAQNDLERAIEGWGVVLRSGSVQPRAALWAAPVLCFRLASASGNLARAGCQQMRRPGFVDLRLDASVHRRPLARNG